MEEDAILCVIGRHTSTPEHCSVMIMNLKSEKKVVAKTAYRNQAAVACLNGEFVFSFDADRWR